MLKKYCKNREEVFVTLADVGTYSEVGFLSFVHLGEVVYMKKHGSGFNGTPPEAYFNHCFVPSHTALQNHKAWLENIRQCIWDRNQFENEMIANNDVPHQHWKRVCWVLDLWAQADRNTIIPKPLPKRTKKHLKNEQRSRHAAAQKRANTSGVGKSNNYYEDIYIPPYNKTH